MLPEVIRQVNWVDILALSIALRILYVAAKNGFPVEAFKLLGTTAAIFVSLHYYTLISDYLGGRFNTEKMPLEFLDFISFLFLASVTYLMFFFLRNTLLQLIKIEAVSTLNKWGGFILGGARAVLLSGLLVFALSISSITYLKDSAAGSYSGGGLFKACTKTYSFIWYNIFSKFTDKEGFNKTVSEVEDGFYK